MKQSPYEKAVASYALAHRELKLAREVFRRANLSMYGDEAGIDGSFRIYSFRAEREYCLDGFPFLDGRIVRFAIRNDGKGMTEEDVSIVNKWLHAKSVKNKAVRKLGAAKNSILHWGRLRLKEEGHDN